MTAQTAAPVPARRSWLTVAWVLMRLSAILLVPLVWVHVVIQDLLIGVHHIDLDYVAMRWASIGWRIYDAGLLCFAFAHGVNGLRQVLEDYIHGRRTRRVIRVLLFGFWLFITMLGAAAVIGGVRS
ncbi:MAG: succinate dehydrogenase [Anaerolineales bacterium]|nr:succinate dehydrogenase [Anaerolineales bacterium]